MDSPSHRLNRHCPPTVRGVQSSPAGPLLFLEARDRHTGAVEAHRGHGRPRGWLWVLVVAAVGLAVWAFSSLNPGSTPSREPSQSARELTKTAQFQGSHFRAKAAVAGRVHDGQGQPLAGARVCAWPRDKLLSSAQHMAPRCAETGVDGAYQIASLPVLAHAVFASKDHYLPNWYRSSPRKVGEVLLVAGHTATNIDISLQPGGVALRGTVEDLSGGPIPGAMVAVVKGRGGGSFADGMGEGTVEIADADGKFQLWTARGPVAVHAWADGYAPGHVFGLAPGMWITATLTPESVVVGRVVHAGSDQGVEGVRVVAPGTAGLTRGGSTFSDAEGNFRIDRLHPGRYQVHAEARNLYGEAEGSVLLGFGEVSSPIHIEVHSTAVVTGRVMVEDGDTPCPSGAVDLQDERQQLTAGEKLSADGSVEMLAVLPGRYQVQVSCDGFLERDDYADLVVGEADVSGVVWSVTKGYTVRGVVVDNADRSLEGVEVIAVMTADQPGATLHHGSDETLADGSFAITGLATGGYRIRTLPPAGYVGPSPEEVRVKGQDLAGVRIQLESLPTGVIKGTLRDEDSQPIAGASVQAKGPNGQRGAPVVDDGRFEIVGLDGGEYRVVASGPSWAGGPLLAPGAEEGDPPGLTISLADGETADVELVVARRRGTITGSVADETGAPATDAFVKLQWWSSRALATGGGARMLRWDREGSKPILVQSDGSFRVDNLANGAYAVRAYRRGGGDAIAEQVAVGDHVQLTIEATGTLSGSVRDGEDRAPQHFTVNVTDTRRGIWRQERFFLTHGKWTINHLPAGKFDVSAKTAHGTAERQGIELDAGATVTGLDLVIEGRATISGRVVSLEAGEPLPGFQVVALSRRGGFHASGMQDGNGGNVSRVDGSFSLEVPAGRVQLFARAPKGSTHRNLIVNWIAVAGEEHRVPDLRVPRRRLSPGQVQGDLGYTLKETDPSRPEDAQREVAFVDPKGPAARAGLRIGDVITQVDGYDVSGPHASRYTSLIMVPAGRSVRLTVARGETIEVVARRTP